MTPATAVSRPRVLVAIPAYNEEATIAAVVEKVRGSLPDAELLVVNDGSRDATGDILHALGVVTATHLANLGYGRAIQTALKYARRNDYDILVTLDADAQHDPAQLQPILADFVQGPWDLMIGSRYVAGRSYRGAPLGRRVGMLTFSFVVRLITGQRVWDTTSGLKLIRRTVFGPLSQWHFVDFHAEALVYMIRLGYRIGEHPIVVAQREHGESMYSVLSSVKYPLKTLTMVVLGTVHAALLKRGAHS